MGNGKGGTTHAGASDFAQITHFTFPLSPANAKAPPSRDGGAIILRGTTLIPADFVAQGPSLEPPGGQLSVRYNGRFPVAGYPRLWRTFTGEAQERVRAIPAGSHILPRKDRLSASRPYYSPSPPLLYV